MGGIGGQGVLGERLAVMCSGSKRERTVHPVVGRVLMCTDWDGETGLGSGWYVVNVGGRGLGMKFGKCRSIYCTVFSSGTGENVVTNIR